MSDPYALVVYTGKASGKVLLYNYTTEGLERCTNVVSSSVDRSVVKNGRKIVRLDVFPGSNEKENQDA